MAVPFTMRELCPKILHVALLVSTFASTACSGDDSEEMNVLPTASATGGATAGDDGGSMSMTSSPDDGATADDTGTGGGAQTFPVTYRFDCIDIRIVGDGDGDGEADGTAFQAGILEQAWSSDIENYKLNIMLTVLERDDAAGTASLLIGSGIGPDAATLCTEPTTMQPARPATFSPGTSEWGAGETCSAAATEGGAGTYNFALGPEEVVYVYAEDDDGTTFNCVPDGSAPDAVPVRAIEASVTVAPGESTGHGELSGCLTLAQAGALCSCLGACTGEAHEDCGGCPVGARPLGLLLDGINPSTRCTELMGEDAFDLVIGFVTAEIPNNPEVCG